MSFVLSFLQKERCELTSCGGTSNETTLRSTALYVSIHGTMKNNPEQIEKELVGIKFVSTSP